MNADSHGSGSETGMLGETFQPGVTPRMMSSKNRRLRKYLRKTSPRSSPGSANPAYSCPSVSVCLHPWSLSRGASRKRVTNRCSATPQKPLAVATPPWELRLPSPGKNPRIRFHPFPSAVLPDLPGLTPRPPCATSPPCSATNSGCCLSVRPPTWRPPCSWVSWAWSSPRSSSCTAPRRRKPRRRSCTSSSSGCRSA